MPYTTFAKNTMLNALTFYQASLHTAYPGPTGQNEIVGGSYARQGLAVASAAGKQRLMSGAALTFNVPAGSTVRWIGFYDNAGNFLAFAANGGSATEFVVDLASQLIRSPSHGFNTGDKLAFMDGTAPSPLVLGLIYYAVNVLTDSFQVSATVGGSAIALTSTETSECQVTSIMEDAFPSAGTESISAGVFTLTL